MSTLFFCLHLSFHPFLCRCRGAVEPISSLLQSFASPNLKLCRHQIVRRHKLITPKQKEAYSCPLPYVVSAAFSPGSPPVAYRLLPLSPRPHLQGLPRPPIHPVLSGRPESGSQAAPAALRVFNRIFISFFHFLCIFFKLRTQIPRILKSFPTGTAAGRQTTNSPFFGVFIYTSFHSSLFIPPSSAQPLWWLRIFSSFRAFILFPIVVY